MSRFCVSFPRSWWTVMKQSTVCTPCRSSTSSSLSSYVVWTHVRPGRVGRSEGSYFISSLVSGPEQKRCVQKSSWDHSIYLPDQGNYFMLLRRDQLVDDFPAQLC